jgi:hypothetical protein
MPWVTVAQVAGDIGQAFEAIVVAVSVIVIIYQLKQQTRLSRIANTQALVGISSPFNLELIKDEKMAGLWVKGSKQYSGFNDVKKYQYKSLLIWWLIFHENIFYQGKQGLLDDKIYKTWDTDLKFFIKQQNLGMLWDELKFAYLDEFRDYVTRQIQN